MPDSISKNIVDLKNKKILTPHQERPILPLPMKKEAPKQSLPEKLPESGSSLPFKLPAMNGVEGSEAKKEVEWPLKAEEESTKEKKEREPRHEVIEYDDALISWNAPEYTYYEKDKKNWTRIIVGAAILFGAIFLFGFKSYTGILLTALSAITFYLVAFKKPRMISFAITHEGIFAGKKFIPYDHVGSFWIFYHPPDFKEIAFRSKRLFMPYIYFPLEDADPNEIRKILVQFLKEEEEQISAVDMLAKSIRF